MLVTALLDICNIQAIVDHHIFLKYYYDSMLIALMAVVLSLCWAMVLQIVMQEVPARVAQISSLLPIYMPLAAMDTSTKKVAKKKCHQ